MLHILKTLKLFILCVFPTLALAGGFVGETTVEQIFHRECNDSKGVEIKLVDHHNNPDACSNTRTIELSCNHNAYEVIVSIALSAFATGKTVDFWVNGCDDDGQAIVTAGKIVE